MGVLLVRSLSSTDNSCKTTLEEAVKLGGVIFKFCGLITVFSSAYSPGFMTKKEKRYYESIETDVNLYWLPGLWFAQNLQAAFMQGCVKDTYAVNHIMEVGEEVELKAEFYKFAYIQGIAWLSREMRYFVDLFLDQYSTYLYTSNVVFY